MSRRTNDPRQAGRPRLRGSPPAVSSLVAVVWLAALLWAPADVLTWVTPAEGASLDTLKAAVVRKGGTVVTLAPEGRLVVRLPVGEAETLRGVESVRPVAQTLAVFDESPRRLGERPPSPEREALIEQHFQVVKTREGTALSRDRARLQDVPALPESVDNSLSQFFPPIRNQGWQGSCTAWAAAYYWNTFTQARDGGLDVSTGDEDQICSPAFIYNLINGGADLGAYTEDAMLRLNQIGAASWSLMPYDDTDFTTWPTEAAWVEALPRRTQTGQVIGHWNTGSTEADLEAIRQHLANGDILVTRTAVYENFYWDYPLDAPGIHNGVLFANSGVSMGGHAMTIVGYDDNKTYHDGTQERSGAFLIANSWGPGWGVHNTAQTSKGFMWVAYDFFKAPNQCFGVAYFNTDRAGYRPRLYAVSGVNHKRRGRLTHRAGVGTPETQAWVSHAAIDHAGGLTVGVDDTRRLAIDMTDGLAWMPDPEVALFSRLSVDGAALTDALVSAAVFYYDFDGTGEFSSVRSADPVVTVVPGETGYATAWVDPAASVDALDVMPDVSYHAFGEIGGPFDPVSQVYVLTNTGAASLDWSAACASDWLSVTPDGGTLTAGASVDLTVALTAGAEALSSGWIADTVTIENLTSGAIQTRAALLDVVIPAAEMTLPAAIGQPSWMVYTGGDAAWFGQADVARASGLAAQSGAIPDNAFTWMGVEIEGPGELGFWWKVSSEYGYDYLDLYVDEWLDDWITGEVDWTHRTVALDEGPHTVIWAYIKNSVWAAGQDCGWVADVTWTPELGVRVRPLDGFSTAGFEGGPFDPVSRVYTLTNTSDVAVNWDAQWMGAWLDVTPSSGTLGVGGYVDVTVALTAAATTLGVGVHDDAVVFGSATTGQSYARAVSLAVAALPGEIAVEDSILPIDDHQMAFGELAVGQARVEQVTIRNLSEAHALIVDDLRMYWNASSVSGLAGDPNWIEPDGIDGGSPAVPPPAPAPAESGVAADRCEETFLVGFKRGMRDAVVDRQALHAAMGAELLHAYRRMPADVVRKPHGQNLDAVLAAYRARPDVAYAEPNHRIDLAAAPNDPRFNEMWGLHNTGQSGGTPGADINVLQAWARTTGSSNVIVAVIDTGIDYTHPDLVANLWVNPNPTFGDTHGARWTDGTGVPTSGNPMDGHGHGTHCAGTIGAVGNNSAGVVGVNWNVRLMGLKFFNDSGQGGYVADAIAALEYALDHGAQLSNNSWGGDGYSQALKDMINQAGNENHLFVTAAGNNGRDIDVEPIYPAAYDCANLIAVANSTRTDARLSGSNWGLHSVDLAAPGTSILSTEKGGGYSLKSGTSMSAPHVAGVAGLLLAVHPDASFADLKRWILDGATRLSHWAPQVATGGRLNAMNALRVADGSYAIADQPSLPVTLPPGGSLSLNVRYAPVVAGPDSAALIIRSNDPDAPEVEMMLSGSAYPWLEIGHFQIEDGLFSVSGGGTDLDGFQLMFRTNLVSGADWEPVPNASIEPDGAGGFVILFDPPPDSPSGFFRIERTPAP